MRAISLCVLTGALLLGGVTGGWARPLPDGISRQEMIDYLQSKGLTATQAPDWKGLPIVKAKVDGVEFEVYFFACERDDGSGRCRSVQFAAGWSINQRPSAELLDAWNRDTRYMRAYIVAQGTSIYGEIDMILAPNGSTDLLDDYYELWRKLLVRFKTHFKV